MDDEGLARQRIASLLRTDPDIEVVGECGDGQSAVNAIGTLQPDLIFLDVQMPAMNGFEVLEATSREHTPAVIFVTAYDRYAVQAFESNAVDYLLKPFKRERFADALQRAKGRLTHGSPVPYADALARLVRQYQSEQQRLIVKSEGRVVFLRLDEIEWIEAAGNYVRVHAGGEAYAVREKISAMEEKLSPQRFLRIHRCLIVNLDFVKESRPCGGGECTLVLRSGKELPVGPNYVRQIENLLNLGPLQG